MHFLLCKIIIILTLIMPITAYADVPTLEGEDLFNQTVERSMTGDLSLNPTDILNMLSDDIMGEIRECTDDVIILFIISNIILLSLMIIPHLLSTFFLSAKS